MRLRWRVANKMEIMMRGTVTEAKLKAGGMRVVIEGVHMKNLEKMEALLESEKEVDIRIFDGQMELPLESGPTDINITLDEEAAKRLSEASEILKRGGAE